MRWTVETLNAAVDAEIGALPNDMRARLARLSNIIEQAGFQNLPRDAVKHLEGRLWELRITGRDGISASDLSHRSDSARCDCSCFRQENAKDTAA